MNRRGFALLATLWFLAASAVVAGAALATMQRGIWQARNRIVLERARWARESCFAMIMAQPERDAGSPRSSTAPLDPPAPIERLDLGQGAWCSASISWPSARINLNSAGAEVLRRLLGQDSLVAALMDWRDADSVARPMGAERDWYRHHGGLLPRDGPLADLDELRWIRGFTDSLVTTLRPLATVDGDGTLDLDRASPPVIRLLPLFDPGVAVAIRYRQEVGRHLTGIEDLAGELDPIAWQSLNALQESGEIRLGAGGNECELLVVGRVEGREAVSRARITLVIAEGRFVVVRQRVED